MVKGQCAHLSSLQGWNVHRESTGPLPACPPQPPLPPSHVLLRLYPLYVSTLLGRPHCNPSSFSCLPLSFLLNIFLKIISLLAIFFLSLLWPLSLPPSLCLFPSISVSLLFFPRESPLIGFLLPACGPLDHTEQMPAMIVQYKPNKYKLVSLTVFPWEINYYQPNLPYVFWNWCSCLEAWQRGKERFAFTRLAGKDPQSHVYTNSPLQAWPTS